jgi:hypothetical protein
VDYGEPFAGRHYLCGKSLTVTNPDGTLQILNRNDPKVKEEFERYLADGGAAMWAVSSKTGAIVYAQANGTCLAFELTMEQVRRLGRTILEAGGEYDA